MIKMVHKQMKRLLFKHGKRNSHLSLLPPVPAKTAERTENAQLHSEKEIRAAESHSCHVGAESRQTRGS